MVGTTAPAAELVMIDQIRATITNPVLRPAKAVCTGCPVLEQCRTYALARPTLSGIWGGTSDRERQALRRAAAADVDRRVA